MSAGLDLELVEGNASELSSQLRRKKVRFLHCLPQHNAELKNGVGPACN